MQFGDLLKKNARMTVFDLGGVSQDVGTEISGMLGEDTLGVLVIHIDYRDGLMKFEYSANRGYQHFSRERAVVSGRSTIVDGRI